MIFFITFLRFLAACLITNSHYTGIYPTDIIANGGLLGDVIFFAVSGYCLYKARDNFFKWYGKRIIRVYPPVIIMTAIYLLLGAYTYEEHSFFWWFIYPTYYHFVASIILLYIPFYVIMKIDALKKRIPWFMLAVGVAYLLVYIFAYDKSYYHIDTVREPMIRFLFFESMLLGAWFRQKDDFFRLIKRGGGYCALEIIGTILLFGLYFASKLLFSRKAAWAEFQVVNQLILFGLLFAVFVLFCHLDAPLERMPKWIKAIVSYISKITLEIYVVQYALITYIRPLFGFPLNWIVLTVSIIVSASILHYLIELCTYLINRTITAVKNRKMKVKGDM